MGLLEGLHVDHWFVIDLDLIGLCESKKVWLQPQTRYNELHRTNQGESTKHLFVFIEIIFIGPTLI